MRLVKLSVERFQCIESAEVEFGPGLNVLYGPNDLGKSSLAWAIRSVLLLQHNSSLHERFISWYGGGEPKVVLTFADANERYWRVTKIFGGSAGLSKLEASRDGRTFTTDANGRQVDEKIRKMLGWGITTPGGTGGQRGLPDAFLIQVLLAEQDNVRKVLFDSALIDDPDESGRVRLTAALGALAQDPMFKDILDEAQVQHDRAFTPTGRKKKSAGSPFTELDTRIKNLDQEHEELEAKVRETAMAEAKIAEQVLRRDAFERELREALETLATSENQWTTQCKRDELRGRIDEYAATIREAAELRRNIDSSQLALVDVQQFAEVAAERSRVAAQASAQRELARDEARRRLDAVALDDQEGDRRRTLLVEKQHLAQEALQDAQRQVERAAVALQHARDVSAAVQESLRVAASTTEAATRADTASMVAATNVKNARQAFAEAERRLRDATSDDKARERELRRSDLHNRRLTRQAERVAQSAMLVGVAEVRAGQAAEAAAEASRAQIMAESDAAKRAVAADEAALARLDASAEALVTQEQAGKLRQQREAFAAATGVAEEAQKCREGAAQLRREAESLRAALPRSLPPAAAIAGLRTLREQLRIAEAQLEVGLSVTIRPKRTVGLHTTVDGAAETCITTVDSLSLAAKRHVAIRIDELVDIEIAAGEESARATSSALRARWEAEGAAVLREHQLDTVEELEKLRLDTDASQRSAEDREREAALADRRVEYLAASAAGTAQITDRIAELEASLEKIDRVALDLALDELGADWQAAITRQRGVLEVQRQKAMGMADTGRQQLARLGAQLEARTHAADAARREADRLRAGYPDVTAMEEAAMATIVEIDRDLSSIDKELATVSTGASDEESSVRADLLNAERELAIADQAETDQRKLTNRALEAAIQTTTRLDTARGFARELDVRHVWTVALEAGAVLSIEPWLLGSASAEQQKLEAKAALETLTAQLDQVSQERAAAVRNAREAVEATDDALRVARKSTDEGAAANVALQDELGQKRLALAEMKTQAASVNLAGAREAITKLENELAALGPLGALLDAADVDVQRWSAERAEAQSREAEQELSKARGALEQVGGAIVRERQREIKQALDQARVREQEVTTEYDAWKMLVEAMKEAETAEGTHLGRALAGPVSQRFRELTGDRYGSLEMGTHLESSGIQVAGTLHEISQLSAGTQDQLATLLRICVAEQLRSSIVLDDHLSQSDPGRVGWFNTMLRNSAKQIQIVLITCRPSELLTAAELPAENDATRAAAAGLLFVTDLTRVIRRYAGTPALGKRQ